MAAPLQPPEAPQQVLAPPAAGTQEPPSIHAGHSLARAIAVEPGATCLDAERLVKRVERWLEQSRVDERIRVLVRGDARVSSRVTFVIDRGDGKPPAERHIDDGPDDCDQLHSALALSIALAIDATLLGGPAVAEELPDDETLLSAPEPEAPPYLRIAVALIGHASSGVLTDVALGAGGRLELGFVPWLDLRAGGSYAAVFDQRVGATDGTFDASLWTGRLDACAAFAALPELRLLWCMSGHAGRFRTIGHALAPAYDESSLWIAVGAGVEVQATVTRGVALAAAIEAILPLGRRTIDVLGADGEVAAERSLSSAGLLLGIGVVFRVF